MSNISAQMVKDLREKTGAGMMDCKQALVECGGDFEESVAWLRKKGHATASKKGGRETTEGAVAVAVKDNKGVAIELNSETDFVARNDKFQALVGNVVKAALDVSSLDALKAAHYPGGSKTVEEAIIEGISVVGENIALRRFDSVSVSEGVVASYVHNAIMENAGKIAVLVALESDISKDKVQEFGKKLAMHIAAAKPECLNTDEVNPAALEKEKEIFREQAKASGKPAEVIEKMITGRVSKYYQEVVLLEQVFVIDNKTKISTLIEDFAKENNGKIKISKFIRYEVGGAIAS